MSLQMLEPYLVDKPQPLIGAETVQLILLREILDYTVLRTEETRELNSVYTPMSISDSRPTKRAAFLGTKQKAAESRELEHLLRSGSREAGLDSKTCFLKDNLCLRCPRCGLFGATAATSGSTERANIKHRIEYSTAFSILPFEEIAEEITFNALNDNTQMTGQALGSRAAVRPATIFPSIVTLKAVSRRELILAIKVLLSCKSYGAESRMQGDCRNTIVGIVAGWEEVLTPLELTLELFDRRDEDFSASIPRIVEQQYIPLAANPDRITILSAGDVSAALAECRAAVLDRPFLERAYADVADYRREQGVKTGA